MSDRAQHEALWRRLGEAEKQISLIASVTPIDFRAEVIRLQQAYQNNVPLNPHFRYRRPQSMTAVRRELDTISVAAQSLGSDTIEICEAAQERDLEARIIESIGTSNFLNLARQRFGTEDYHADCLAWAKAPPAFQQYKKTRSDDQNDWVSLFSQMRRSLQSRNLPVRVEVRNELVSKAATGDGVVYIAGGLLLDGWETSRIVLHEVEGHVMPWFRRKPRGLWGRFARAIDSEEGSALLLEYRHNMLDERRKSELGFRHLAAVLTHDGADFTEVVRALVENGSQGDQAVSITSRVMRGGGLGRERVYLPAFWDALAQSTESNENG